MVTREPTSALTRERTSALTRERTSVSIQRTRISTAIHERPKSCRFQLDKNKYYEADTPSVHDNNDDGQSNQDEKEAEKGEDTRPKTPRLPKIVAQVRRQLMLTQFVSNTTRSIERKRRLECPCLRGSEMQHFYSVWQQPLTTPKDRMRRPLRRVQSLFKDFRYADEKVRSATKPKHGDFGIIRPCCSQIRSRIRMPSDPF